MGVTSALVMELAVGGATASVGAGSGAVCVVTAVGSELVVAVVSVAVPSLF